MVLSLRIFRKYPKIRMMKILQRKDVINLVEGEAGVEERNVATCATNVAIFIT